MRDDVRVAAASVDTKPGRLDENLGKIAQVAASAAGEGAQLVLTPELSLTGFIPNHPLGDHASWLRAALAAARKMALLLESPAIDALAEIAARHRLVLSVGMLEDAGPVLYNTQVLVGGDGLLAAWRKMHVPMFEMPFYNPGPAVRAVSTPLGRLGANICFDVLMPESTRLLAVDGVEIVLMPFAADPPPPTPEGWAQWAGAAIRARAVENGVFAVACNYVGHVELSGVEQTFPGGAMIMSPRGETVPSRTIEIVGSQLSIATLQAEELARARSEVEYLFRFRRPEIYGPLAEPFRP